MRRKTIWRIHSWLGLVAGVPLLVIAFSGSVLVFKDELNTLLIPGRVLVEPRERAPLSLDNRWEALREQLPDHVVVGWVLYPEPDRSDFVYVVERGDRDWRHVYQDPYTGEVLSPPARAQSELMGWILLLHYSFLGGDAGMAVSGGLAIVLCLLGGSGFYVYRNIWKSFFTFRWRTSLRLLSGNLHKRLGVVSAPVFLILGVTGAYWNINEVVHHISGEHEEPKITGYPYGKKLPLETMREEARGKIADYRLRYIDFPREAGRPVTFYGRFAHANPFRSPYHSTVSFDPETGVPKSHSQIDEASLWRQLVDAFTPLHFGSFGGFVTRVIWCVLGAVPGFLAISGFVVNRARSRRR